MIKKYIAGNTIKCVLNISKEVMKINKIPVINYAVEESYNSLNTFNEYKELNNKIDNRYRIALKLSSFNFDEVIIDDIIDMYKEKGIKILIDAESNELNNKYHNLTNKLIQKHNKNDFNIIKTYQMYRKDSLNILNASETDDNIGLPATLNEVFSNTPIPFLLSILVNKSYNHGFWSLVTV